MIAVRVVEGRVMRVVVGSFDGGFATGLFAAGLFAGGDGLLLSGGLGATDVTAGGVAAGVLGVTAFPGLSVGVGAGVGVGVGVGVGGAWTWAILVYVSVVSVRIVTAPFNAPIPSPPVHEQLETPICFRTHA